MDQFIQVYPSPLSNVSSNALDFRFEIGFRLPAMPMKTSYEHAYAIPLQPEKSYVVDNNCSLGGHTYFIGLQELLRVLSYSHFPDTARATLFDVNGMLCLCEALSIDAYYRCISEVDGRTITEEKHCSQFALAGGLVPTMNQTSPLLGNHSSYFISSISRRM